MKPSLLQKGLLLVSIPLCFEVGFFAILLHLQNELEAEANRINNSRLIGDTVARVTTKILVLEDTFQHFQGLGEAMDLVKKVNKEMEDDFTSLLKLSEGDAETHNDVENIITELKACNSDYDQLRTQLAAGAIDDPKGASKVYRKKFTEHFKKIRDFGLWRLSARSARELNTDRSSAIRKQAVLILKCALAISCLIGFLSAFLFSRYLIARLQRLSFNAKRLGQGQELLPKDKGDDEIAAVDKALHGAADEIKQLQQVREEIIGMISHDIRSPLTTIKCAADALSVDMEEHLDEDGRQQLKNIDENCDRILSISRDLLDIQRFESGTMIIEKERGDVRDCVVAAVNATEGLRKSRGVQIDQKLSASPAQIDPTKIEQVVINLLSNAIKFSPRNGTVTIELKIDGGWIYFAVSDQGKGIPNNMRKEIFTRFKQVESDDQRLRGGTGLGLAIAKALVEAHGGKIGAEPLSPRGSRFYFSLPAEDA